MIRFHRANSCPCVLQNVCLFIHLLRASFEYCCICIFLSVGWIFEDGESRMDKNRVHKTISVNICLPRPITWKVYMFGRCLESSFWRDGCCFFSSSFYLMAIRIFMMFGREMAFMFAWANIYFLLNCEMRDGCVHRMYVDIMAKLSKYLHSMYNVFYLNLKSRIYYKVLPLDEMYSL